MSIYKSQESSPSFFEGYARHKEEAVYPSLQEGLIASWPGFLGYTGITLRNATKNKYDMVWQTTPVYGRDYMDVTGLVDALRASKTISNDKLNGYTLFARFKSIITSSLANILSDRFSQIQIHNGIPRFVHNNGSSWHVFNASGVNFSGDTNWHTIAMSWDGVNTIKTYIDGLINNTVTGVIGMETTGEFPPFIGGRTGLGNLFNGYISGCYFYNRMLNPVEQLHLYRDYKAPLRRKEITPFFFKNIIPPTPIAPLDSRRQRIIDKLVSIFQTITTANGFRSEVGNNVYEWKTDNYQDVDLPAMNVRDVSEEITPRGTNHIYTLTIEIEARVTASTSTADAREVIADIHSLMGSYPNLDGLAYLVRPLQNTLLDFDKKDKKYSSISITLEVQYATKIFQPYT